MHKQTNAQTNSHENITSLAEAIRIWEDDDGIIEHRKDTL